MRKGLEDDLQLGLVAVHSWVIRARQELGIMAVLHMGGREWEGVGRSLGPSTLKLAEPLSPPGSPFGTAEGALALRVLVSLL